MPHNRRTGSGGHARPRSAEETDPGRFRWIVDGHNAIFAITEWEDLQISGQKREARRGLEEALEAFGRAAGCQVWVVYDGNHYVANPDAVSWPHLRTEYSYPPEEADDRIRFLARRAVLDGEQPIVVTSDRRTLAASLPPGARSMPVRDFFQKVHGRVLRRPEKWSPGDMEDIERHFLESATDSPDPGDEDE